MVVNVLNVVLDDFQNAGGSLISWGSPFEGLHIFKHILVSNLWQLCFAVGIVIALQPKLRKTRSEELIRIHVENI